MAKNRFYLKMANGNEVLNLTDLRRNGDLESVMAHFNDGTLVRWLEAHDYDESEEVKRIDKDAPDAAARLIDILQLPWADDGDATNNRREKEAKLRKWTKDESILSKVDSIALDDEELVHLLKKGFKTVYLCAMEDEVFNIRSKYKDVKYVGILGTPEVETRMNSSLELKDCGITVENIKLPFAKSVSKTASYKSFNGENISNGKPHDVLHDSFKKAFNKEPGWVVIDDDQMKLDKYDKELILKRLGIRNNESENVLHVEVTKDLSSGWALSDDAILTMGSLHFSKEPKFDESSLKKKLYEHVKNITGNEPSYTYGNQSNVIDVVIDSVGSLEKAIINDPSLKNVVIRGCSSESTVEPFKERIKCDDSDSSEESLKACIKYEDIAMVDDRISSLNITCKDGGEWRMSNSSPTFEGGASVIYMAYHDYTYEESFKKLCVFLNRVKDL